jgi:hypothetical protein
MHLFPLSVAAAIEAVVKRAIYISEMSQTCDIQYSTASLLEMRRVARP